MNIQAILFDKNLWTAKNAYKWVKGHGYNPIKRVHITKNYYRYRITDPKTYRLMRIKNISDNGIKFIIGYH